MAIETPTQLTLANCTARIRPGRQIDGIAAALLPYDAQGRIAEEDFARHLQATHGAGLRNAVNMDTGYVNLLTDEEKERVLDLTRQALGEGTPFVAGAYIEGQEGDVVALYRREMERIRAYGGTPILFQTARLHGASSAEKVDLYRAICQGFDAVYAFELGQVFAPCGEIWDLDTFQGIMDIPAIRGAKHSSLDPALELQRLELRDRRRPDFQIFTGNDHVINMVEYGSDYLLGLATFCPEKFGERDHLWAEGDPAYYELSAALQYLGAAAFREPVPAYKHSAATFLKLTGRISTAAPHPDAPRRPEWEADLLRTCATRLGLA